MDGSAVFGAAASEGVSWDADEAWPAGWGDAAAQQEIASPSTKATRLIAPTIALHILFDEANQLPHPATYVEATGG